MNMTKKQAGRCAASRFHGLLAACVLAAAGWAGAGESAVSADEKFTDWPQAARRIDADGALLTADGSRTLVPAGRYERIVPAGRVAIVTRDRAWGLIDADGQAITALRYQHIEPFGERGAPQGFVVTGAQQRQGVLDAEGRVVTDATWTQLRPVRLWPQEPLKTRWLFEVRQAHREGVLDASGRAVIPVQFGSVSWVGARSPWVIVSQGGLQGVCHAVTGECPLPLSDKRYDAFAGLASDTGLLSVTWAGRRGLLDDRLRELLAPVYSSIETLHAGDDGSVQVLAQFGLDRHQFVLAPDEKGLWQVRQADRPRPLRARRDDHPIALRMGAVIDARYVPVGLGDAGEVHRAFVDRKLRELRQPSIQLSAWTAYVGFDLFARPDEADAARLPDVWTRCPDPVGVRLVAWYGELAEQAQACASPKAVAVRLKPSAPSDGILLCEGCEALGLPARWVRRDEPPVEARCASSTTAWSQDQARRDFARWLGAWLPTWQPLLRGRQPSAADSEGWRRHQADPSRAMSTLSAVTRRPEALLNDIGFDAEQAPKVNLGEALLKWIRRAEPVGDGGLYPEPEVEFAGQCARVWYVRLPGLDKLMRSRPAKAGQPFAMGLGLPPAGRLERQAYPFLTFSRGGDGGLQLTGVSREFLQAVWLLEGGR